MKIKHETARAAQIEPIFLLALFIFCLFSHVSAFAAFNRHLSLTCSFIALFSHMLHRNTTNKPRPPNSLSFDEDKKNYRFKCCLNV